MLKRHSIFLGLALGMALSFTAAPTKAQLGNSGSIEGVVKDPSGGVIAGAKVEISFPVTGYQRETTTGSDGSFQFTNIPFNPYHLTITAGGFASYSQDVDVRSSVPIALQINLKIGTAEATVKVEAKGEDLVEKDPSFHTDVDTSLIDRLPLESQSSSVSSLVTLGTPGVVADSNGLFHGLGITLRIRSPSMGNPLRISRAKYFPTRFRWTPFNPSKPSREDHRQNTGTKPA